MSASGLDMRSARAEWRTARRLYAIYSGVITMFDVGVPPCPDLECPIDRGDAAVRNRVRSWLALVENHCPVAFLRQVLQRDRIGTQANLETLIRRHLERPNKTDFDRDKLDFLLVQYFAQLVPENLSPGELTTDEVGRVLAPVLGHWTGPAPYWLKDLDALVEDVSKCHCMQDLEDFKVLERGRKLKAAAGARFFEPPALIAFTRYNIILRRAFFYTMRADLDVVRMNVVRLEKLGVKAVDATRAGLSERESLASVRRICAEWRSIFRTDYSAGHVSRSIKELRACTDSALAAAKLKHDEEQARRQSEAERRKAKEKAERDHAEEAAQLGIHLEVDLSDNISDDELEKALAVFEFEEEPKHTVETAYPELTVDADPVAGTPARFKIPDVVANIQAQYTRAMEEHVRLDFVKLEHASIDIAPWESEAFRYVREDRYAPIRSSVATRLILEEAFEDFQDGYTNDLQVALTMAHGEAGRMQERIAEARDARNVDWILRLAATGQRLLRLMHEAQYAWNKERR